MFVLCSLPAPLCPVCSLAGFFHVPPGGLVKASPPSRARFSSNPSVSSSVACPIFSPLLPRSLLPSPPTCLGCWRTRIGAAAAGVEPALLVPSVSPEPSGPCCPEVREQRSVPGLREEGSYAPSEVRISRGALCVSGVTFLLVKREKSTVTNQNKQLLPGGEGGVHLYMYDTGKS